MRSLSVCLLHSMTKQLWLAGTPCCARLTAIGFSSNLPVLIVDTHGQQFQVPTNIKTRVWTCSPQHDSI